MTHHWSTLDATTGKMDTRPKSMEQDVKLPAQKKNVRLLPYRWKSHRLTPAPRRKQGSNPYLLEKQHVKTCFEEEIMTLNPYLLRQRQG